MVINSPEDEAKEILTIIDRFFPKIFEAKESIKWLHRHTCKGNQTEWQGFFFEEYCRPLLTNFLGGWYGTRIIKSSRIDYQRYYNWDLKVHAIKDKNGTLQHGVLLNDKAAIDRIIETESGLGFIICYVDFTFDNNKKLLKWRDNFEKRTRSHSSNPHVLKNKGKVVEMKGIFIDGKKMLRKAKKDGWIKLYNQGVQPSGASRNPKYQIKLNKIPKELFINQKLMIDV